MIVYSIVYSRRRLKKTSKLRVSGLREGKSLVTDEFPAQRASHAKMFPFDDVIMYNRNSNIGKYTYILKQLPLSQITVDMRRAVMHIPFKNKWSKYTVIYSPDVVNYSVSCKIRVYNFRTLPYTLYPGVSVPLCTTKRQIMSRVMANLISVLEVSTPGYWPSNLSVSNKDTNEWVY